jgi:polysaccharide export outer membrane protein
MGLVDHAYVAFDVKKGGKMMQLVHVLKKVTLFIGCGMAVFLCASCAQMDSSLSAPSQTRSVSAQEYLIGPEDVVEVMVWKNADLSRTTSVRPDGKISLPLIGDVQAAGLTAELLRDSIAEKLQSYYKEPPQISVILQQINSYAIYVLGEVRSPGKYVVKTDTTFLQAVTLAGGFTEFASKNRIVVRRREGEGLQESSMGIKYADVIAGKQNNILLRPGDTIIIP